jgi:hypothetical protein
MTTSREIMSKMERDSIDEFSRLVDFAKGLVIKDSQEAEKFETSRTVAIASAYIEARLRIIAGEQGVNDRDFIVKYENTTVVRYNDPNSVVDMKPMGDVISDRLSSISTPYAPIELIRGFADYDVYNGIINVVPSETVITYKGEEVHSSAYVTHNTDTGFNIEWLNHSMIQAGDTYTVIVKYVSSVYELNDYYRMLIGKYGVDIFKARYAEDFDILKIPSSYLSENEMVQFQRYYTKNLVYFKRVLFTYGLSWSSMYRKFARMFVVFMTIQNMLNDKMESIFNIDLIDEWTVKNLLYSMNIDFLDDLHISQQKMILKNLNDLFRYKGTDKIFSTILGIFGFDNVQVYSYYLSRNAHIETNSDGKKIFKTDVIQFNRVPYGESDVERYIVNNGDAWASSIEEYNSAVETDDTWMVSREEALAQNFSLIQSKYISVSAAIDLTTLSMNTSYLYTLICWIQKNVDSIELSYTASEISPMSIELIDSLIAINLTACKLLNFTDSVNTGSAELYGFNLDWTSGLSEAELLSQLSTTTQELITEYNNTFLDQLSVTGFLWNKHNSVSDTIDSMKVVDRFNKCISLKNVMTEALKRTTDHNAYDEMNRDFNKLYHSTQSLDLYGTHTTLTSYLQDKSPQLLQFINDAITADITNATTDNMLLRRAMETIIHAVESFIYSPNFKMHIIGTEYVVDYIRKLINYFKAYTVDLKSLDFYYITDQVAKVLDHGEFYTEFSYSEDKIKLIEEFTPSSEFSINESVSIENDEMVKRQHSKGRLLDHRVPNDVAAIHKPNETVFIRKDHEFVTNNSLVLCIGIDDDFIASNPFQMVNGSFENISKAKPSLRLWKPSDCCKILNNQLIIESAAGDTNDRIYSVESTNSVSDNFLIETHYDSSLMLDGDASIALSVNNGTFFATLTVKRSTDPMRLGLRVVNASVYGVNGDYYSAESIYNAKQGVIQIGKNANGFYFMFGPNSSLLNPVIIPNSPTAIYGKPNFAITMAIFGGKTSPNINRAVFNYFKRREGTITWM